MITGEQMSSMVQRGVRDMEYTFSRAHYRVDIESLAWDAIFDLTQKEETLQTYSLFRLILYRKILRELTKHRNIFVADIPDSQNSCSDFTDEICITDLDVSTLTDDEKLFVEWLICDSLTKTDIAELTGMSLSTVHRTYRHIITKLKERNV